MEDLGTIELIGLDAAANYCRVLTMRVGDGTDIMLSINDTDGGSGLAIFVNLETVYVHLSTLVRLSRQKRCEEQWDNNDDKWKWLKVL